MAIDVYTWPTPNGHKIHIALEELGLPYRAVPVDIAKGDQFQPDFLKISPNNKVPAIVDPDGPGGKPIALMESGAILIYLAEKTGKLWPQGAHEQSIALQWLCFQVANIGPMLGQVHHFRHYAPEPLPYAVERFTNETKRLYGVLDTRLAEVEYLTGGIYGMSDIAIFPWLRSWEMQGMRLGDYPHLERWFNAVAARPAVQRGIAVLADQKRTQLSDAERDVLFGARQYERR
ncbi:glutathione S-transferase N-terminal domain-containing protein [Dongia sedimenti]|uniref:Glutathione S-transferase N-terminal domain-containing protein n=1 Tax=Dongia sedimenti TaxID=3064282 RepID=A0ABU0YT87_9PROT|nr:glutathione S-transferase N-terminal domain-containing protein [Rhodospirillaceae bacterium R-7]